MAGVIAIYNEQVMKLIEQQSAEPDAKKRLALVATVQRTLEEDGTRPGMGWRVDRFAMQPYVKNLCRIRSSTTAAVSKDVWLDR